MTFVIGVEFQHGTFDLEIQPLAHPAVESWMENFVGRPTRYYANLQDWNMVLAWDPARMDDCLADLQLSLDRLQTFGIKFLDEVPKSSRHLNRHFLNICHRFFTERQKAVNDGRFSHLSMSHGPDYESVVNRVLSDINQSIHELELYMPPARNPGLKSFEEIHVEYDSVNNQWENSQWWSLDEQWRSFHTSADQHVDVILTSEILGKTVLKSYLDDDDPHHWDTSGHYDSLGGLQIQLGPKRRHVYQSQDFKYWYGRPTDNVLYDYPIGNVTDPDCLIELGRLLDQSRYHAPSIPVYYKHN